MGEIIRVRIDEVNTQLHYSKAYIENMEFKLWLAQQMAEKQLGQADLARLSRVPQPTIQRILSGETSDPRGSTIGKLERALGVNPDWLPTGESRKEAGAAQAEHSNISPITIAIGGRVPLISLVAAGNWEIAVDNLEPGQADEWVSTTVTVKKHTYALRVSGDSMEPRFPSGAIIIVEPEEEARNGSFVIVRQNGSEATFKQLVIDGGQKYLKPLNDRYPIMQMLPDAVICGVVKQMVMDV